MHAFITGGAGFVGSHLADHLLARGDTVTVFDLKPVVNDRQYLNGLISNAIEHRTIVNCWQGDITNRQSVQAALSRYPHDVVYHLGANADVSGGASNPTRDLEINTLGTSNVLEAMRAVGPQRIVFASSGAVYGNPTMMPIPEDHPFPIQTSLYGASKVAAEGLISAYCYAFGFRATILRFEAMSGERYRHGVIYDFVRKLQADPEHIEVIGDGRSMKGYLYVGDAIAAVLLAEAASLTPVDVFNVGSRHLHTVNHVLNIVCEEMGLKPDVTYTGTSWAGDARAILFDTSKIRGLGWREKTAPGDGIRRTVRYLLNHPETVEPWKVTA